MKKILISIDWFLPAYKAGGPVQSIANFVNHFKDQFDISIITSDRDLGDTSSYPDIPLNTWILKDGYRVMYLDPGHQTIRNFRKIFSRREFDILYLNSLFSVPFTLKPLLLAKFCVDKIVLAPRGMLGAGALQIKSGKKNIFLSLSKWFGLFNGVTWHATAESEKQEIIKNFGGKCTIKVASNLPGKGSVVRPIKNKPVNEVHLFFLSRISPKKNLLGALKILQTVTDKIKVTYSIVGPIDDPYYWEQCQLIINQLPDHIKVNYHGAVPNFDLQKYLLNYHFLFLPTLHENYGHVIVESLQYGCPVIISDCTPWRNLGNIKDNASITLTSNSWSGIGWDLPLEYPDKFVDVIEYCARMGQEEYDAMSREAFDFAQKIIYNIETAEATRRLFEDE